MLPKSIKLKRHYAAVATSLLLLSSFGTAADLTPGFYNVWKRPTESVDLNALMRQNPSMTLCVSPEIASNPIVTSGDRPNDTGCTASKPTKVSATTETYTLSCPQIQTTGSARLTKQGDTFVTVIEWQGKGLVTKSVVTGVRIEGCVK
jgi:Protein of unknown function (DUF3617)